MKLYTFMVFLLMYVWICSCAICCMVVELCWCHDGGKKSTWKWTIFPFLFVLKWICSPLLRVTTNHLYTFRKMQIYLMAKILCVCQTFPVFSLRAFPCANICENELIFQRLLSVPGLCKWTVTCLLGIHQESEKQTFSSPSFSLFFFRLLLYLIWF